MSETPAQPITTANPRAAMFLGESKVVMEQLYGRGVRCDVVWADPPYYLSAGGTTCSGGERVSVDKGEWDTRLTREEMASKTATWLLAATSLLKPSGTIWVCGTLHNIFMIGDRLDRIRCRILNHVIWQKPNPPPNLACRTITHSHESILWASLGDDAKHYFNYNETRAANGGKQLKDVWEMPGATAAETRWGRHPCQKPVALIRRCLLASCPPKGLVLDPFAGSGSTGVATLELGGGRKFIGIEQDKSWVEIAAKRLGAARVQR